ncbi:S8 family peptidase [Curtobacterium flaccumfaciens]|uniref:S8 family peptidase n=1 Tax=Curtobacterium flaccumfaciens TaxID=2035 RepID=UPI003CEC5648
MANQPIQVVTNPSRLQRPRDKPRPNSAGRDFFLGDDAGFVRHQGRIAAQISDAIRVLTDPQYRQEFGGLGYVRVRMRQNAIAKSHRPQTSLFRKRHTPHVATGGVGEPIFACTPDGLRRVLEKVVGAEQVSRTRTHPLTGEVLPNPSRARCEVSAIDSVVLWADADKRSFSADEAAAWLQQSATGGRYDVELFPFGAAGIQPPALPDAVRQAARALETALVGGHVAAEARPRSVTSAARALAVGVVTEPPSHRVALGILADEAGVAIRRTALVNRSDDPADHAEVLRRLGRNPLVRSISLPPVLVPRPSTVSIENEFVLDELPATDAPRTGIVGVIDGGVGDSLKPWITHLWEPVAPADIDAAHGTFIGGLLVAGGRLNPGILDPTRPPCGIADIRVLPADPAGSSATFNRYYPGGVPEFFDEIEEAVREMRQEHGIRIFNLSINLDGPGDDRRYGFAAQHLDAMARAYDVIFVISAGNLDPADQRAEWGNNPTATLTALARENRTTITEPAESLFNVTVSALNPTGLNGQIGHALTRYSRRGPGLRGAVKPELAHIGGSGTPDPAHGTGLRSFDESGFIVTGSGTSYAAPLVARELADLDAEIDGELPRETLLALLIHDATMPAALRRRPLDGIATDLAGFGVPARTSSLLERPDTEIVMVFNSIVQPGEEHDLTFAWPAGLVDGSACRGYARLTLVAQPVLAYEHGDERIRVNIDAKLMQEREHGGFDNALRPVYRPNATMVGAEKDLLAEAHKWQVMKSFETAKMRGRGKSSTWKFLVEYLTRADEDLPIDGVKFAAVLTIADPDGTAPVFQQMRQQLGARGIRTANIRTGIRTRIET